MEKTKRVPVEKISRGAVIEMIREEWEKEISKKGPGIFVSSHELRGVLDEEVEEVREAVHKNDRASLRKELRDVIVACLHGIASIDSEKMDW